MTQPQPDRLDRIEAILGTLADNQVEDRERLSRIEHLVESNARAIAANSDETKASIRDLVNMITTQADQAAIERVEFRATVQQLLEVLTQRFSSNGGGQS